MVGQLRVNLFLMYKSFVAPISSKKKIENKVRILPKENALCLGLGLNMAYIVHVYGSFHETGYKSISIFLNDKNLRNWCFFERPISLGANLGNRSKFIEHFSGIPGFSG